MSHNINNGLLNIIRKTDPMIIIVSFLYLFMQRTYADSYGLSVKIRCRPLLIIVTGYQARCDGGLVESFKVSKFQSFIKGFFLIKQRKYMMRSISLIVIHCTATHPDQTS